MGKLKRTVSQIIAATGSRSLETDDSAEVISVPDRTAAVVGGIREILVHHDATPYIQSEISDQIGSFLNTSSNEKVWVKRFKYLSALPLAQYLRNELPVPPEDPFPFKFKGKAKEWMKSRIRVYNEKNTHLWTSWLQNKRCCLPSSEDFIEETYQEHLSTLTKEDNGNDFAIDAIFSDQTFFNLLLKLRKGLKDYVETDFTKYSGSRSAAFDSTRSEGGQQADLRSICDLTGSAVATTGLREMEASLYFSIPHTLYLSRMDFFPRVVGVGPTTVEKREFYGREDWESLKALSWKSSPIPENEEEKDFWWARPLCCTVAGVVEPLKVRVISKGESLPYYSQRWLQKALHNQMRKMDCFRLLDRPISATDLSDLMERSSLDEEWFSIDYSAATDNLSWRLSSRILRVLLAEQSDDVLRRALTVLGPHRLFYMPQGTRKVCDREERGLQSNGQLMGSILSFPILCLANLGVYLVTNSLRQRSWTDEQRLRAVLVNGDDMLYRAPRDLWKRHIEVASDVGLKMSVGKAYHHGSYANINSTSINCPFGKHPKMIPYFNTGLFFQSPVQKKVSIDVQQERKALEKENGNPGRVRYQQEGVVPSINALLDGCRENKRCLVLKRYLGRNKEILRDECLAHVKDETDKEKIRFSNHRRNLFLHPSVGGMGILPPAGWKFKIKKIDRQIASGLVKKVPVGFSSRPLIAKEVEDVDLTPSDPWYQPVPTVDIVSFKIDQSRPPKFLLTDLVFGVKHVALEPTRSLTVKRLRRALFRPDPVDL